MDNINIANNFNDFISDIGPNFAKNMKCMKPDDPLDCMSIPNNLSIYLYPCTSGEIESITKCLLNTKAVSLDGFPMKLIKYIIMDIYVALSAIFNSSFVAEVFPDTLKHAKVIPVFKSGDKFNITNSLPISVLPILSKIMKKLMYNRLISFMNSCKLLCDNLASDKDIRHNYMALLNIIGQISASIDDGKYTIGIFLDLSKAFDTINHDILLHLFYLRPFVMRSTFNKLKLSAKKAESEAHV